MQTILFLFVTWIFISQLRSHNAHCERKWAKKIIIISILFLIRPLKSDFCYFFFFFLLIIIMRLWFFFAHYTFFSVCRNYSVRLKRRDENWKSVMKKFFHFCLFLFFYRIERESKSESKFMALSKNSSCCVRQNALNENKRAHKVTEKDELLLFWIRKFAYWGVRAHFW